MADLGRPLKRDQMGNYYKQVELCGVCYEYLIEWSRSYLEVEVQMTWRRYIEIQ